MPVTKAIRFHQTGGPEVLRFEKLPPRRPGPDEVLLKLQAVGLNRAESMYYHGTYMQEANFPSGIGYEASGESWTSVKLRDRWRAYIEGWWNYFRLADWREWLLWQRQMDAAAHAQVLLATLA